MLRIEQAEIGYSTPLISIPSLELESGKLVALIGRNGIGKSTFLQTIIGSNPIKSGEVILNERSLSTYNKKQLAQQVSLVRSTFTGNEFLSVREYLLLGRIPYTNLFGTTTKNDLEVVKEVIGLVSIEHLESKFTNQLSDGEKQLVAIAQSLVQQTSLLLLDEPTAFLDYENKWKVLQILKKCTVENGLCTVFSTHDLELALKISDELLLVNPITKQLRKVGINSITLEEVIAFCFPNL